MSFDIVCSGCGAPSGPSVGICPFCKTIMSTADGKQNHSSDRFVKLYQDGKLEQALSLGDEMYRAQPDLKKDLMFVMTFAKTLIESEAPSSKTRSLLAAAHLENPENKDVLDYIELIEAKNILKKGEDSGETMLRNLIRRSPQNIHAQFILGAHLFWVEENALMAIPHLETSVRLHPNFLRAWGCLAVAYRKIGNTQLAQSAFRKCAEIETDQRMKDFFEAQSKA